MEWKPRRAYTGDGRGDWAKVVTEMDMNNQKAKENALPSFRPAEVGGPGRRFVGLNRMFESAILRLRGGFTPLAQPTAWVERGGRKREKGNLERESRWEKETLTQGAPISVTPAAIPLLYLCKLQKSLKIAQNFSLTLFCPRTFSRGGNPSSDSLGTSGNSWRSNDDKHLSHHWLR